MGMTTRLLGLGLVLSVVLVLPARAQYEPLNQAVTAYDNLDYDTALNLFGQITRDESADKDIRKQALRYLGLIYVAKSLNDQARQTMVQLLELEPPIVELDPDRNPPPLMNAYYEARKELNVDADPNNPYAVPTEDPGIQTIAVMDFRNYSSDKETYDPMQWGFSSMMIEQLSGATDLKIVERENLQWLLQEQDLQRDPSRVDQTTAVRMGRLMGAHAMVFGSIFVNGRDMRLAARVVKVETSEVLLGESVQGRAKDFYELLEKLSLKISQSLNSTLTETQIGARTDTRSLDAMHSYSQGMAKLDQGDYRAAYEKFQEALDYDPSYTRAKNKAESIKIMLAADTSNESGGDETGG